MNQISIFCTVIITFCTSLVFAQWTQLGSNMPGDSDSEFGNNVDFNYAGNIMIAGTNANYAKVYQEQGGEWTQLGNTITGPLGEGFGWAVSINGAGNIIAIGEFGGAGKVHVYELINNSWTPLGSAVEGGVHNGFFDNFGFSIDLNESGNRFVASSIYANLGNGEEAGFVQVYEWINGQWTQVGSTVQGNAAFSNFGWKVEMTADGSRFIANADGGDEAIYVFEEVNGEWQTIGQVFLNSQYGNSILYNCCIDKTGNTIAFSQYNSPEVTRVFSLENELWVQKGNAIPFRGYCSLNGEGSMVAISNSSALNSNGGLAKIYQFQSNDWIQLGQDIIGDEDHFLGVSNDLNYVGNRFLVGAVGIGTGLTGATQVYENSSIPYAPIPYLTELPDIIAECAVESIEAPLSYNSTDNSIEGISDTEFPITESTTILWTYDDGNGFVSFQEQSILVEDAQAPIPDAATLEILIAECEISTLTPPTASDNCSSEVFVSHDAVLPIITQGTTIIHWTYDDGKGNITTQEQVVLIADLTSPIPDAALLETVISDCEVTTLEIPGATDNCSGEVFVSNDITLPITQQGSTIVTWTYEDSHGNFTTQEQVVMINDTEAPVPDMESLPNILADCQVDELSFPTATDNCAAEVMVSHDALLPIAVQGMTLITWTFDDGNGNIAVQEQMVIIEDTTAPLPELESLPGINAVCEVNELITPSATDNCAIAVSVSNNAVLPITAIGSTTVIWTYNDGHGNTTTQNQEIIIEAIDVNVSAQDNVLTANADDLIYQWVDCNNGNEPIEGATSQSYTPTVSGNYAVIINQNGCEETSDCVAVTIISVDEISADEIVLFPNPTSGIFQIQSLERIQNVRVYDAGGKEIDIDYVPGSNHVNCGKVASGYYIVEMILEETIMRKPLTIQ